MHNYAISVIWLEKPTLNLKPSWWTGTQLFDSKFNFDGGPHLTQDWHFWTLAYLSLCTCARLIMFDIHRLAKLTITKAEIFFWYLWVIHMYYMWIWSLDGLRRACMCYNPPKVKITPSSILRPKAIPQRIWRVYMFDIPSNDCKCKKIAREYFAGWHTRCCTYALSAKPGKMVCTILIFYWMYNNITKHMACIWRYRHLHVLQYVIKRVAALHRWQDIVQMYEMHWSDW